MSKVIYLMIFVLLMLVAIKLKDEKEYADMATIMFFALCIWIRYCTELLTPKQ